MLTKIGLLPSSLAICLIAGAGLQAAELRGAVPAPEPEAFARITSASYCNARPRALELERLPPSWVVLKLHMQVVYHNSGTRPIILPSGRELTVYSSVREGTMLAVAQPSDVLADENSTVVMKELPPTVNPENPASPNNAFRIIPAGATAEFPLDQDVALPVNHKELFHHDPDLRGHRVYVRLQFHHQDLDPALEDQLSGRWGRFGAIWTGTLKTNTMQFDVPASPAGSGVCVDTRAPVPFDGHAQTGNGK
jgi:hypothetical protein